MNRWLKYALIGIGTLFTLLILLFAGVSFYINSNKAELISKFKKEAETKYHTQVTIDDLSLSLFKNFPSLSLIVENVDAKGPMYQIHKHKFFSASKIYLRLNTLALLTGKLSIGKTLISNGNIYIYTDSTGLNNLSFFKSGIEKDKKAKKPLVLPDNIEFQNFDLTIEDKQKEKLFSFLINNFEAKTTVKSDTSFIDIKKNILVKSLGFNLATGAFLMNHILEGEYQVALNTKTNDLSFGDIQMNISKQPFSFKGKFVFGDSGHFNLDIKTKKISYPFAQTLVTQHIAKALKNVAMDKSVEDVHTTLEGSLNGGDPLVIARFIIKETKLTTPLVSFDKASFSGFFCNEIVPGVPRKDPNSTIRINQLSADWQGIPIKADSVEVLNLSEAHVNGSFSSDFQLSTFNNIINSDKIIFSDGEGKLKIHYNGPLKNISNNNALIDISFLLKKGNITYRPLKLVITECVSDMTINNSNLNINNLSAKSSNGSKITITGAAKNTLSLLGDNGRKADVRVNIYSPLLDLSGISSKVGRDKSTVKKKSNNGINKTINQFDHILEKEKISVYIKADKIINKNLQANNFIADFDFQEGSYRIRNVEFGIAGGSLKLNSSIQEIGTNRHTLNSSVSINNIDARKLFYAFDDFGMEGIGYKNLTGQLTANGSFSTNISAAGVLDKKTINGNLNFSLKNGSLINYAPIMKIQEIAFKKRDFSDIKFVEIKNKVSIKEGIVSVPRMQIESSVFNLFIEGQYGFAGNTDLRIQVPFKNLKKVDPAEMSKKANNKEKGGASVYLRAKTGSDGKIGIAIDAFGAVRKNNVETPEKK
ncbi:MAG: hypothetical protein EAZ12_06750 [Sphingobacteriia bacterium]|nr:MAG: hypothetical protein EAZ12_06750 [Sphingobacteriia bacterium]